MAFGKKTRQGTGSPFDWAKCGAFTRPLEETGSDNWNDEKAIWTAYLRVPSGVFLAVESDTQKISDLLGHQARTEF